ncbi:MAG: 5-(carboxyamino)imidazole ribonucleotide synthase [Coriobacteriia bacterium]|nr:5-(carboxyamino)imidazole ribonucleotide synthase [Coriobacteriia bacterium]
MTKIILPSASGTTIGIIGGGQLGRMMALSARQMGYKVAVLEPGIDSPTAQIADIEINAAYDDKVALEELLTVSDVVTYEFENIPYAAIKEVVEADFGYLPQGHRPLEITQNRLREKTSAVQCGFGTAPFADVSDEAKLRAALVDIAYPSILKTVSGGYDGKGQWRLKSEADLPEALEVIQNAKCILEGFVPFDKEISVIAVRSTKGEVKTFPVFENDHANGILHLTSIPADISDELDAKAHELARDFIEQLDLVGTLAIEMFVVGDELLINEMAPRPHNSGHLTIDACNVSQFEQHVRAICGLPLIEPEIVRPAVMVNLLGQHVDYTLEQWQRPEFANGNLHLYGKDKNVRDRKVGHITFCAEGCPGDTAELQRTVNFFLADFPE